MADIYKLNKDITLNQGADFSKRFGLKLGGTETAVDISGWSFVGKIKTSFTGSVIDTLSVTITDATGGIYKVALTDTQTAGYSTTNEPTKRTAILGVYTIDATDGSGVVYRVMEGRVYLSRTSI